MYAALLLAIEISDDDVALSEVASQCGYDFSHRLVNDVAEPVVAEWHGEPCLSLRLSLTEDLSGEAFDDLLLSGTLRISHPSVSSVRALCIQACA